MFPGLFLTSTYPDTGRAVFPRIDINSHCDTIHSTFTAGYCFNDGLVGRQPVAGEEYVVCVVKV